MTTPLAKFDGNQPVAQGLNPVAHCFASLLPCDAFSNPFVEILSGRGAAIASLKSRLKPGSIPASQFGSSPFLK